MASFVQKMTSGISHLLLLYDIMFAGNKSDAGLNMVRL